MTRSKNLLGINRNFKNLWLAQTGSNIGDWFNQVALAQTTLAITHSAEAMGLVLLCRSFPGFALGPLISPLVDHVDKKKVMIVSDLLRALFVLIFVLAVVLNNSACLFIGAFLLGLGGVMFNPAAQACLPHIVKSEELAEANAISSTTSGFVTVFSTILGGAVATFISPVVCFSINSVSYLWSAFLVSRLITVKEKSAVTKAVSSSRSIQPYCKSTQRLKFGDVCSPFMDLPMAGSCSYPI